VSVSECVKKSVYAFVYTRERVSESERVCECVCATESVCM